MTSPFPGMNPYLESPNHWRDFHTAFNIAMRRSLVPQVRPKYIVTIEETLYIDDEDDSERRLLTGVGDVSTWSTDPLRSSGSATAILDAPRRFRLTIPEFQRQRHLEIKKRDGRQLVCLIELLSPNVKTKSRDLARYLQKRGETLASDAHFVEIDLLRCGRRIPGIPEGNFDYYAMVSQCEDRPESGLWTFGIRDPMPVLPIPLLPGDRPATLDLNALLNQVYDEAGYEDHCYDEPPEPPLAPEDAEWATSLIRR